MSWARAEWRRLVDRPAVMVSLAAATLAVGLTAFARVETYLALQQAESLPRIGFTAYLVQPLVAVITLLLALGAALLAADLAHEVRAGLLDLQRVSNRARWRLVLTRWLGMTMLLAMPVLALALLLLSLRPFATLDLGQALAGLLALLGFAGLSAALATALGIATGRRGAAASLTITILVLGWTLDRILGTAAAPASLGVRLGELAQGRIDADGLAYFFGATTAALGVAWGALHHSRPFLRLLALLPGVALLAIALAWRGPSVDLTATARHSLLDEERQVLEARPRPRVLAWSQDAALKRRLEAFWAPFAEFDPAWQLQWLQPMEATDLAMPGPGLMLIHAGRREYLGTLTRRDFVLAVARLTRPRDLAIGYLSGSGETALIGAADYELGRFARHLEERGATLIPVDLVLHAAVPEGLDLLIATSTSQPLPGIDQALARYAQEGALLWLLEPDRSQAYPALTGVLGVTALAGTVVDADASWEDPRLVRASRYLGEVLQGVPLQATLWPQTAALVGGEALVQSGPASWNETTLRAEQWQPGGDESTGPLTLVARAQGRRAVIAADTDWLSNRYLGNGGNLELGLRLVDWLSRQEGDPSLPLRVAPDQRLDLPPLALGLLGLVFIILLPALLVLRARRRRHA